MPAAHFPRGLTTERGDSAARHGHGDTPSSAPAGPLVLVLGARRQQRLRLKRFLALLPPDDLDILGPFAHFALADLLPRSHLVHQGPPAALRRHRRPSQTCVGRRRLRSLSSSSDVTALVTSPLTKDPTRTATNLSAACYHRPGPPCCSIYSTPCEESRAQHR